MGIRSKEMELSVGAYVVCGGIVFILLALGVSVFMDYCERRKIRKNKKG